MVSEEEPSAGGGWRGPLTSRTSGAGSLQLGLGLGRGGEAYG